MQHQRSLCANGNPSQNDVSQLLKHPVSLLPCEEWQCSPSRVAGVTESQEISFLKTASEYITAEIKRYNKPSYIQYAANSYVLRYTRFHSITELDCLQIASVCFLIACKSEDCQISVPCAVQAYFSLKSKESTYQVVESQSFQKCKGEFVEKEFAIFSELGFDTEIHLPHPYILKYKEIFANNEQMNSYFSGCNKAEVIKRIIDAALTLCDDSFVTPVSLFYHPLVIGCACIHFVLIWFKLSLNLVNGLEWYHLIHIGVSFSDIESAFTVIKLSQPSIRTRNQYAVAKPIKEVPNAPIYYPTKCLA